MPKTYNLTGTAHWVKVLGEPVENYREDGNEWTIDVTPNERGIELLRRIGLGEKLRNKDDDRDDFITFRRNELSKKDNTPNKHIEVVDAEGAAWDPDVSIGNGSTVKIKFSVFDMPAKGKFKAIIKPVIYKITVLELVEYKPTPKDGTAKYSAPSVAASKQEAAAETPAAAPAKKVVKKAGKVKPKPEPWEEAGEEEESE